MATEVGSSHQIGRWMIFLRNQIRNGKWFSVITQCWDLIETDPHLIWVWRPKCMKNLWGVPALWHDSTNRMKCVWCFTSKPNSLHHIWWNELTIELNSENSCQFNSRNFLTVSFFIQFKNRNSPPLVICDYVMTSQKVRLRKAQLRWWQEKQCITLPRDVSVI